MTIRYVIHPETPIYSNFNNLKFLKMLLDGKSAVVVGFKE